jgi:hypothetical protein
MSVRATTTHIDKYAVTHRIDLVKTGYGGSATELRGTDGFIQFTHENLSESDVFSTSIQKGRLDYGVWINSDSEKAVVDEILVSQEGDFIIKWYRDSVLFWTGTVVLDLSNFEEGAYPYRAQLTSKDLSFVEGINFPVYDDPTPDNSFASRRTLISIIAECLPYSLNIVTATSWIEANTTTTIDFLRQVYLDASSLAGLSMFGVLERIMSANGLFLKQTDGVWLIEQLSAHTTPSAVTRWTYNASGVYQSEAVVNPIIVANSELNVVTGSISSVAPAYKQVAVQYDSLIDEVMEIPDEVIPVSGQVTTFSQQYLSTYDVFLDQTNQALEKINFTATAYVTVPASQSFATKLFFDVRVQIFAGNMYSFGTPLNSTLGTLGGWFASPVNIVARAYFDTFNDGLTKTATYKAQFNVETDYIPAPTTTDNYGRLNVLFFPNPLNALGKVRYENIKFELIQGEVANIFQLTQTDQYSTAYEQTVFMGDGPRAYANSALRYDTGALSLGKVTDRWQRRGSTDWRAHSVNLAKEIMDFQRSYGRTLQVVARKQYSPSKTLSYDSLSWYYIGGMYDGFTGDWTMTFVRNQFVTQVDTFAITAVLRPASIGTGIIANISNQSDNMVQAAGQFLLRLLLEATGTLSQIFVTDIDQFVEVREGQILRIVHPVTLQSDEVTVTADRISGSTINVATTTLSATYPIGSYVYVSAQSMQAGIIVGENAVRIYAEGQSLGRLAQPIDGTVTQIEAHLYTKLVRGMDFLIINQQTGRTYSFNVDQDTAGPGVVTFNVQEQIATARVGDYLVGDNSFQQSQITVSQGEIVLKVDSNNRVALVRLSADNDSGSEIDISAEQVKINGIIFTEGTVSPAVPGDIKSSNYLAGADGWKIEGNGDAEFNNVVVRGEVIANTGTLGTLNVDGTLTIDVGGVITNSDNSYFITVDGLVLESIDDPIAPTTGSSLSIIRTSTTLSIGSFAGRHDTFTGDEWVEISAEDFLVFKKVNGFDWAKIDASALAVYATTDSSSKDTGSIITEGGIGVEKSAYIGTNLRVLGTTESTSTTTGSTVLSGGLGVAKNVFIGGALNSPLVTITEPATTTYNVTATDTHIAIDSSITDTINLPTGTAGRKITMFNSASSPITINRASTNLINGATSITLSTVYESVTLLFYGGNWTII